MEHLSSKERLRAIVAMFVAVVLFASAFVAIRAIVTSKAYPPGQLTLARFLVASLLLLILAGAQRGLALPKGRDWIAFILLGAVCQGAYQFLLNAGEQTVDSGTAALLVSCSPILASLIAVIFMGEHLTWIGWVGTAIAFAGAAVIAMSSGVSLNMSAGVLMVIVATLLWATFQVGIKSVAHRYNPLELTAWPAFFATIALLPWGFGLRHTVAAAPLQANLAVIWLGAFSSVGGFLAWSYATRRVPVVVSSNALFGVPVAAFIIGYFVLGEVPTALAVVGGAVAIGGVALAQTKGRPLPTHVAEADELPEPV